MTTLLQALRDRNISVYRLVKEMNIEFSRYTHLANKLKGKVSMTVEELDQICEVITTHSGKELKPSDIELTPVRVRLVE